GRRGVHVDHLDVSLLKAVTGEHLHGGKVVVGATKNRDLLAAQIRYLADRGANGHREIDRRMRARSQQDLRLQAVRPADDLRQVAEHHALSDHVISSCISNYSAATAAGRRAGCGRRSPRWSRKVDPSYSSRNRPRRRSSGTTSRIKSVRPPGRVGAMTLKPSA